MLLIDPTSRIAIIQYHMHHAVKTHMYHAANGEWVFSPVPSPSPRLLRSAIYDQSSDRITWSAHTANQSRSGRWLHQLTNRMSTCDGTATTCAGAALPECQGRIRCRLRQSVGD